MVRRVQRAGTTLFDPRVDPHHHLVCTACGSMEDLDFDARHRRAGARGGAARLRARAHRGRRARPLRVLPRRGLAALRSASGVCRSRRPACVKRHR